MNKTELIAAIAEKAELTKKDSDAAVNAIITFFQKADLPVAFWKGSSKEK